MPLVAAHSLLRKPDATVTQCGINCVIVNTNNCTSGGLMEDVGGVRFAKVREHVGFTQLVEETGFESQCV